ncbi:MAG: DUF512 domain-containing protein [Lachnospiraceae bacterium]|jgi:putative radical SAM enzyme (TIGR03279 family)|nr:DUF512 domain-containing protein [Lachnospiraceae bacterium]
MVGKGMEQKHRHRIMTVEPESIAKEIGMEPGDLLLSINGQEIQDVLDYHFLLHDEMLTVLFEKPDGEEWEVEIEKDYDEDLGIGFEEGLMDCYQSCRNKCMFCFIDQMPPGMRETLYFKDDDARLSFLQGNYITLTNMSEEDFNRIIHYKLSPINLSVHTTNPQLRVQMLHNRFAGNLLERMEQLAAAGIEMNSQVVLCKGYNDGAELDRTIAELSAFLPHLKSLSVVPVGLTKYREGLEDLEQFSKEEAMEVLIQIHGWQERLLASHGTRFVFASDEWYLLAEHPIPPASYYEGYGQMENGVGMVRSLVEEVEEALPSFLPDGRSHQISIATGVLAAPFIKDLTEQVTHRFPGVQVTVYPIQNEFFGTSITVAGLLTAQDIIAQLRGKPLGEALLLPEVMFRDGEEVFLDDLTCADVEKALQTPVHIVKSDGESFLRAILLEF